MSLAGNLRTMDLPEVLQWIAGGRKTGVLHLVRGSIHKQIAFRDGVIFTSSSNDPRESLGQFLIRDRLITEDQLFKALLRQEREGRLLGALLVSEGLLIEDDLRATLAAKATETIYDLFLWSDGGFEFKDGESPQGALVPMEMEVTGVILEGIRRVDEWSRIRAVFPSMITTFKDVATASPGIEPDAEQALALAATGRTIAEIGLELRLSEFDTASRLFDLYNRRLLNVDRVETDSRSDDPVGLIKDLLAMARRRTEERRYDAALKSYEEVLALDRLNQNAKKGLIEVLEAKRKERALKTVPLNKVPVLKLSFAELTKENFDPQEGFVLSRINGEWDVQSILKMCPIGEEAALLIFATLLERKVIEME